MRFKPSYLNLKNFEFDKRIEKLFKVLKSCELCPRKCGVNRLGGEISYCQAGKDLVISSFFPHFGEEDVLVGKFGSGTIFLAFCNLRCAYCQNYEISHFDQGSSVSEEECAKMMLKLQEFNCHNINFVTPTHFTPQIIKAVQIAAKEGLRIPIVWNCGGYENLRVIKLLNGIVDIYMPDFKYGDNNAAKKYSEARIILKYAPRVSERYTSKWAI